VTETQIRQLLALHKTWIESNQKSGRQLVLEGEEWTAFLSAHFTNCRFENCRFMNADMRGLRAEGCDFTASDFTRADLTDAILPGSVLTNCVFDWSWLVRTDLRSATLTGVRLENARLLRTKLYNERRYQFARPSKMAKELDVSPEGDASLLAGIEGLERLLELRTA